MWDRSFPGEFQYTEHRILEADAEIAPSDLHEQVLRRLGVVAGSDAGHYSICLGRRYDVAAWEQSDDLEFVDDGALAAIAVVRRVSREEDIRMSATYALNVLEKARFCFRKAQRCEGEVITQNENGHYSFLENLANTGGIVALAETMGVDLTRDLDDQILDDQVIEEMPDLEIARALHLSTTGREMTKEQEHAFLAAETMRGSENDLNRLLGVHIPTTAEVVALTGLIKRVPAYSPVG